MRRSSVSLPTTKTVPRDPFEKPERYKSKGAKDSAALTLENVKAAWMSQTQRSRYVKTGGFLLFIVILYWTFFAGSSPGTGMLYARIFHVSF